MKDQKREVKKEKLEAVAKLTKKFTEAKSAVFVGYQGMNVLLQQDLKKKLADANASMFVAKNTQVRLAGRAAKFPEDALTDTVLSGQTAVVLSNDDPITPISILGKFIKEKDMPQFKAGIVEGSFQDKENLQKLSALPGKDVLFGQVISSIASPMYGLIGTLQGNIQKLLWILSAKNLSSGHDSPKN